MLCTLFVFRLPSTFADILLLFNRYRIACITTPRPRHVATPPPSPRGMLDYSSTSVPCYGALVVTPDLATYSSDTFFRFQVIFFLFFFSLVMSTCVCVCVCFPEMVSARYP